MTLRKRLPRRRVKRRGSAGRSTDRRLSAGLQMLEGRWLFALGDVLPQESIELLPEESIELLPQESIEFLPQESIEFLPQDIFDTSPAFISPTWFEDLGVPEAPRHVNPASLASSVEETSDWGQLAVALADDDQQEYDWVVRLHTDTLGEIGSISETVGLLTADEVEFEVLRGLGLAGQVLVRSSGATVDVVADRLAANQAVVGFELDVMHQLQTTPNDPSYRSLWGMENTGQVGGRIDADIDMAAAWDISTGSSEIVVAVIDTGVDYTHSDLAANIWTNPGEIAGNGIDDDGNGFVDDIHGYDFINRDGDPMDDHSHGTHVAGTIAAVGNNGRGVAGVNWTSSIMALKFLSSGGWGYISDAVQAVNYSTMMRTMYGVNVRVTNNSWGGGGYSSAMSDAIQAANNAGILFVAAAGNRGSNNDVSPHYPSNYNQPNVLAVAATDSSDNLAYFSSYGANTVHLAAPGVSIYSTVPGNRYSYFSGTSMATPHVAGVAALAWSVAPDATLSQIKSAILDGTDPLASLDGRVITGGRLNAVNTLLRLPLDPNIGSLLITPSPVEAGATVTLTATEVYDLDGTIAAVHFYGDTNGDGLFDGDDQFLGQTTTIAAGKASLQFDTTDLTIGAHSFFARAVDDGGLWGSPAVGTLNVVGPDDHGDDADSATPVDMDPAVLFLDGNLLVIDPAVGFSGQFEVTVTIGDGFDETSETFTVTVGNEAPVLVALDDRTMSHTQDTMAVSLQASDADGDPLTFAAHLVTARSLVQLAYELDQQLGLTSSGDYHENWLGMGEKYVTGEDGAWYYLLGDGRLYRLGDNASAGAFVAQLDASFHADPTLLHEARPGVEAAAEENASLSRTCS